MPHTSLDVKHHQSSQNESLRGGGWGRRVPLVIEDGMPLEVLRGAPFVAHQAKQIEMSGGVRVAVAWQNTLHVLHQVLPLVRGFTGGEGLSGWLLK